MDVIFMIFVILTTYTRLATLVIGETCEEIMTRCHEHDREADGERTMLPSAGRPLWPVTEADLQEYRPFGDAYCRQLIEFGNCGKTLYSQCPEVYNEDKNAHGGWYGPEWTSVLGRVCNTTIGAVKFVRAFNHCGDDKFFACCFHNGLHRGNSPHHEQNGNASAARQTICHRLQTSVEGVSSPEGMEMSRKCGEDALNTVKEAQQQLYADYC